MKLESTYQRANDALTHLAFALWAVLALWFFQERMYADSGFYIAKVVHYESFWVELDRFILIFSECLPLLCMKLGLPLKTVLLAYSVGHVLFFYGNYLIARYHYQNRHAGWMLLAIQTVGILHGFCAPGFEFYYGGGFLVLWAVVFQAQRIGWANGLFQLFLLFFILTSHQVTAWLIGGILLLHFSEHKFRYWKQYLMIGAVIITSILAKKLLTAHTYEAEKMAYVWDNLMTRHYGWEDYIKPLLSFYWEYYKELWAIALLSVVLFVKEKRYVVAVGFLAFLAMTQYLIALTYIGIRHTRYQEQCFFPLIFVACFPLFLELKKQLSLRWRWGISIGTFCLIVYRFVLISLEMEPFTHRVNYMHRIIEAAQDLDGHKFIAKEGWFNPSFADMNFSFNMESILLSGLNPDRKTIQIIRDSEWRYLDHSIANTLQDTNLFMFTYRGFYDKKDSIYRHQDVNPYYFDFPAGPYRHLNCQAPLLDSLPQLHEALEIKTYQNGPYPAGTTVNILVKLTNNSNQALPSQQIKIGYHWWKDGNVVEWEGHRNLLEIDVLPNSEYYQYLIVNMPAEPGHYELQVDPFAAGDGMGWMGLERRVAIVVEKNDESN